jgi:hypothetical protein
MNGNTPKNTGAINVADIKIKDTLDFKSKKLKQLPELLTDHSSYVFSYNDQCFYYIKTLDENKMQYSIVKCGADNKEMGKVDISSWVQHLAQQIVDSGLCKSWHYCFTFHFQSYHQFVVLEIAYSGEKNPDAILNKIIVFDPTLKAIANSEDISLACFLASKKLLAGSDSLFLEDLRGEQVVSYRNTMPSEIYKAKENEAIFWDRERSQFYSVVTNSDTLSVYNLFDQQKPVIKIFGLHKTSNSLFIDNNLLFIFNDDNIYHINIETRASTGYNIKTMNYCIYPNKNGFFCHYNNIPNPNGASYTQAYTFIPFANLNSKR